MSEPHLDWLKFFCFINSRQLIVNHIFIPRGESANSRIRLEALNLVYSVFFVEMPETRFETLLFAANFQSRNFKPHFCIPTRIRTYFCLGGWHLLVDRVLKDATFLSALKLPLLCRRGRLNRKCDTVAPSKVASPWFEIFNSVFFVTT